MLTKRLSDAALGAAVVIGVGCRCFRHAPGMSWSSSKKRVAWSQQGAEA
jgi:hypothetical protein